MIFLFYISTPLLVMLVKYRESLEESITTSTYMSKMLSLIKYVFDYIFLSAPLFHIFSLIDFSIDNLLLI